MKMLCKISFTIYQRDCIPISYTSTPFGVLDRWWFISQSEAFFLWKLWLILRTLRHLPVSVLDSCCHSTSRIENMRHLPGCPQLSTCSVTYFDAFKQYFQHRSTYFVHQRCSKMCSLVLKCSQNVAQKGLQKSFIWFRFYSLTHSIVK